MTRRQTSCTESAAIGLFFRYCCCGWYPGESAPDQPAGIGRLAGVFRGSRRRGRCFLHLANLLVWRQITGAEPPNPPFTATEYDRYGMPWFQYYRDTPAVPGSGRLAGLQSVAEKARQQGKAVLPDNQSISPEHIITLRRGLSASPRCARVPSSPVRPERPAQLGYPSIVR